VKKGFPSPQTLQAGLVLLAEIYEIFFEHVIDRSYVSMYSNEHDEPTYVYRFRHVVVAVSGEASWTAPET
jgi:hypothetical protein